MDVLIAGCGWLGKAVGSALIARGDRVVGVRRSTEGMSELESLGIEPLILDLASPDAANHLPRELDAVVATQSAAGRSPDAYRRAYVEINRALLAHAAVAGARAFVYTGSTGVFGQLDGSTVDETTPPLPTGPTASHLVEAEAVVSSGGGAGGPRAMVVRLSGLYGPGRYGVVERVRRGVLATGPGDDAWMNWCHLEDAVRMVVAALDAGRSRAIYHASDAHPSRRREVVLWIAERLGIEPPFATAPPASRANRRVSAERSRSELGVALAYPSFRDGLAGAFKGGC